MNKVCLALVAATAVYFLLPVVCAATSPQTYSGTVVKIYGSGIVFKSTNAATYSADTGNAQLLRRNGVAMKLEEFLPGDKISVTGTIWADNSINAVSIKDLSLYTHTGAFTGKITTINTANNSFTMESKTYGEQTIFTTNFTSYTKNGTSVSFGDLELGMTASVKGVWDRSNKNITASFVAGAFRLIAIDFTGTLSYTIGNGLTVLGNGNVLYGVDASNAKILSKNSKAMEIYELNQGETLRVWGKHISGMVSVVATEVKDLSVVK